MDYHVAKELNRKTYEMAKMAERLANATGVEFGENSELHVHANWVMDAWHKKHIETAKIMRDAFDAQPQ